MSACGICGGAGILLVCYRESRDYDAAACVCPAGRRWRTPWQLQAWASRQTPPPSRVCRLEEIYTDNAIAELPDTVEAAPPIAEMFA